MKSLRLSIIVLSASAIFVSCQKEVQSTDPLASHAAPHSAAADGVPFKGDYTTTHRMLSFAFPYFSQEIIGTGEATHLGSSSFQATSHVTIRPGSPSLVRGSKTFTAANGDEFYTEFAGTSRPVDGGYNRADLVETIIGGTGRFENARGTINTVAMASTTPGVPSTVRFDGKIKFAR